jgi:hypothetical protein
VEAPDLSLTLTEFPDPEGELVYLKPPVPEDRRFVADELLGRAGRSGVADGFYDDLFSRDLADAEGAETLRRLQS